MSEKNDWASGIIIWTLLFVGFCGLIGLAGTIILSIPFLFTTGFVVLAIGGLALGFILLKRHPRKLKLLFGSLISAILLAPIYVPIGIAVAIYTPVWVGYVQAVFNGPDIAISATSPDGNFEAYVVNDPSIDPPNQSLFIERSDGIHFRRITKLPEDIDSIERILWSPQSDIVVFQTRYSVTAVHLPDYKKVEIPLGPEWKRKKPSKRSTFNATWSKINISDIEFPKPGAFTYQLEGSDKPKTIEMNSL